MSIHPKQSILPFALILAAVLYLMALRPAVTKTNLVAEAAQTSTLSSNSKVQYIRRSALKSQLTWNLNKLGNRLERPGQERLSLAGTIRQTDNGISEIALVLEFPNRLWLTTDSNGSRKSVVFDDVQPPFGSPMSDEDKGLLETLVYDSAEHFFLTQTNGTATRFLGSRHRLDDISSENYAGPYYDIYQVADKIRTAPETHLQSKFYYFNSDTFLLDRIAYETIRNGAEVKVETLLGDWRSENGQQIPYRIERLENGKSVSLVQIRSANLSQRANDGLFDNIR